MVAMMGLSIQHNLQTSLTANFLIIFSFTISYIPELQHPGQEDVLNKSKNMKDSMTDAKTWLEKFMEDAKKYNVLLKTELINSHRPVDYVILEYAEQERMDLIVIGTRGRSSQKNLLLGSVASSVVTYAHCPVMVVK